MTETVEIVCKKCGQVSLVRSKVTPLYRVLWLRRDVVCFACGTPFDGGPRNFVDVLSGWWVTFLYFGVMTFFFGGVGGIVAKLLVSPLVSSGNTLEIFMWCGGAIGALWGIHVASRARVRGEIMYRHKEKP